MEQAILGAVARYRPYRLRAIKLQLRLARFRDLRPPLPGQQQDTQDGTRGGREHAAFFSTRHVLAGHRLHGIKSMPELDDVLRREDPLAWLLLANLAQTRGWIGFENAFVERPVEHPVHKSQRFIRDKWRRLGGEPVAEARDLCPLQGSDARGLVLRLDVAVVIDAVRLMPCEF